MGNKTQQIYDDLTQDVIDLIESGKDLPWVVGYEQSEFAFSIPTNLSTGVPYSGTNCLSLFVSRHKMGYSSHAWLTFRQARKLGGHVKRGEKGTHLVRMVVKSMKDEDSCDPSDHEDDVKMIPVPFTVFNLDQIDGISVDTGGVKQPISYSEPAAMVLNHLVENYKANSSLQIKSTNGTPAYCPRNDVIYMPDVFHDGNKYARSLAHELTHSTGHHSRFDRFANPPEKFDHSNLDYAFEELIAELGAVFLGRHVGIEGRFETNCSYLKSWLEHFKSDTNFLIKATSYAAKSTHFLLQYAEPLKVSSDTNTSARVA